MKFLILCALIAGAYALPVDEKYRWNVARDQDGRQHVVDVNPIEIDPEPSFNAMTDVRFLLFTRRNPNVAQIITFNMATVANSNWINAQGARFIIHGWNSGANTALNGFMTRDFLALANHNVVVVDWSAGANSNYVTSRNRVGAVGGAVANMINSLRNAGHTALSRVHIVGHSLGSHVAGHAGKQTTLGRPQVIFATDPAGPLFSVGSSDRLAAADAVYTEAIHTNAGELGFDQPITTAAFYPNWGSSQPGCGLDIGGICSHERSNLFYSESINSNRFVARRCTGYNQIVNRNCPGTTGSGTMGMDVSKTLDGVFFLETNNNSPFARG